MSQKNVLVVLAHPDAASYGSALGNAYVEEAGRRGHSVRVLRMHELEFDPILHRGYRTPQGLEADLQAAQAAIRWADHLAFVYPIWWGGLPAVLKGFIDRVFLPGFAFRYEAGKAWPARLLQGRSAHVLVTMDTPPWYFRWVFRAPGIHQLTKTTLEFCGVKPVRAQAFGPILGSSAERRHRWLVEARALAARI